MANEYVADGIYRVSGLKTKMTDGAWSSDPGMYLVANQSKLASITGASPGEIAFTAGYGHVWQLDADGATWVEVPMTNAALQYALLPYGQVSSSNISSLGTSVAAWPVNRIYGISGGSWKTRHPITDLPEYTSGTAVLVKECAMIDTDNAASVYIVYRYITATGDIYTAYQMDSSSTMTAWSKVAKTADLGDICQSFDALPTSSLSIGGGWVDLALTTNPDEILEAALSGHCVINLIYDSTETIICHQSETFRSGSNTNVFFTGMFLDNVLFIINIKVTASSAQAMIAGTISLS